MQRLEKLLESACIKLSSVATDITGVSGRLMLQALIDSEAPPIQQRWRTWPNAGCGRRSRN